MIHDDTSTTFTPPTIEEIASLLPAYDILSFIAQGGMGAVYMATQKSLERPVAIKVLPRHFGEDAEFRASFEAEAKSMAKLNHPNLIGIYDFGQVDGLLYIIMEMVKGKSLYHSAYGKIIAPSEAARIVYGICRGLANAHKHGILHRDIKPANILLDPSASPKIGDFGLARPVGEHEKDSAFGTPGYTAPEVIHRPQAVDESTDIFAVGVLLYELLTSKLPENNYTPVATIANINPKFDQIIRKAIHPTPAMRYRSADAMADALKPLTKEENTSNPLLTGATSSSTPSISTAKALLTEAPKNPATILKTAATHGTKVPSDKKGTSPPPSTPTPTINVGSNVPFIRNIIIIIGLLAAIVIAWQGLKKVKADRMAEKARNEKLKKEEDGKKSTKKKSSHTGVSKKPTPKPKKTFVLPKPKPESARETLSRLQPLLKRGSRAEMPKGSITRADRTRFYINEPMSWHKAQAFCEQHGGHLAVLPEESDMNWLVSKLESDQTIWLGAGSAGNKQWCWIDGTPWKADIRSTSKAAYVAVDETSILSPHPPSKKHSFFIEWYADGSTPASLKNQLKRSAAAVKTANPIFPAGTVSYDNRNYLLIEQSCSWDSARRLAQLAGGALAVPSNPDENQWMLGFVSSTIHQGKSCWIGGLRETKKPWQWASGESWEFAKWAPSAPDADTSTAAGVAIIHSAEWKDYPLTSQQAYFLIEWSQDAQGHKTVQSAVKTTSSLDSKRRKCATLIEKIQQEYEKNLTSNIKGYEQELRAYNRTLPKSLQEAYAAGIQQMRSRYINTHIPADLPRANMPEKAAKILDSRVKRQDKLDADYLRKTETIREKYRSNLHKTAQELKAKGLTTSHREIQEEINNTSSKGSEFVDYIMGAS